MSSNPWMQDLRSYFYIFFNFFKQCFVVQCASLSPLWLLLFLLYFILLDATLLDFLKFFIFDYCSSAGKESACNVGDLGSIPGLGRSPGEGKSYPLQYSDLENSMGCIVHGGLKKSDTTERLTLSLLDCPLVVYRNATDFCWFYSFQLCWINFSNRFVCICAFVCMYNL